MICPRLSTIKLQPEGLPTNAILYKTYYDRLPPPSSREANICSMLLSYRRFRDARPTQGDQTPVLALGEPKKEAFSVRHYAPCFNNFNMLNAPNTGFLSKEY